MDIVFNELSLDDMPQDNTEASKIMIRACSHYLIEM